MSNNNTQNNLISEAVAQYEFWRRNNIFKIKVGDSDEIAVVGSQAYHNSIPTRIFNYCLMKAIMTEIGTTPKELQLFEGQFYETREITRLIE